MLHRLKPSTMEDNPLWLVVLCDLMTNLMLFFLIMFAMNRQPAEVRAEFARTFATGEVIKDPGLSSSLKEMPATDPAEILKHLVDEGKLAGAVELVETEESVRVRLKNEILFPSGESILSNAAVESMVPLARLLAQMKNTVVVEGHTDSLPIRSGRFASNWQLSIARSHAVIQSLAQGGVKSDRLVAAGYGEFHPVEDNNTPENRARNRRVEIVVLRSREDL